MRFSVAMVALWVATPALAQQAQVNVVTQAADAFGLRVGNESLGLYGPGFARGFSPSSAGNIRIDGLYFVQTGDLSGRVLESSRVSVGLTALAADLPAPSGVVDYGLRQLRDRPVLTLAARLDSFVSPKLELDATLGDPAKPWSLALGTAWVIDENDDAGGDGNAISVGVAPRWQPAEGTDLSAFLSIIDYNGYYQQPSYFTVRGTLPPRLTRNRRVGQAWAEESGVTTNAGLYGDVARLAGWQLRAGLFYSRSVEASDVASLDRGVAPDGTIASRLVVLFPRNTSTAWSGEVQAIRSWQVGDVLHRVLINARGRRTADRTGGEVRVDLGPGRIGAVVDVPKPAVAFGPTDADRIETITLGLGYRLEWRGRGELNLGLQRADYRKTVSPADAAAQRSASKPWLYNASVGVRVVDGVIAYAGYARGLEESGSAPSEAINAAEGLPATITTQRDAGLRFAWGDHTSLILGVFDIRKPYANVDGAGRFRFLGALKNQGVELSLTTRPVEGLTVVVGGYLARPRLTGEEVASGRIDARPVGFNKAEVLLEADYQLPGLDGWSIDGGLSYNGARWADPRSALKTGDWVELDVGARWRFALAGTDAVLRAQVANLFNAYATEVFSNGAFTFNASRRWRLSLTADI
jgi:iron complex outermembrane receptor protein